MTTDMTCFGAYFNPYWSNVELNATALFVVPGKVSSSNRRVILQCFLLVFTKRLLSIG